MARHVLDAIKAVLQMDMLPDGRPMPAHLSHALLVLATYWPNIHPGQKRLAREMRVSESQLNRRLAELEAAGLIVRLPRRGTTTQYRLKLGTRIHASQPLAPTRVEEQEGEGPESWGF